MKRCILFLAVLALLSPLCLSSPVPNGEENAQEVSDDVKELESLRAENNKPSNNTDTNPPENTDGQQEEPLPTPLPSTDAVQQNSRSGIFRHRGITEAKKSKYWSENPPPPQLDNNGYGKYAGIQYSPHDLAAYVFNTGDEEGVAVAVEELVREGMMGRTDAINYLQDVKQILMYLRDQYEHQKKLEQSKNKAYPKLQMYQRLPSREHYLSEMDTDKREAAEPSPVSTTEHPHQGVIASTAEPKGPIGSTQRPKTDASTVQEPKKDANQDLPKDVEYKRMPTRNSNTFTLEVIYKLAKDMFTQSILRDDPTAEDTLSGLVTFLENEVGNKRISAEMKEKVLEVVSAALVDSLRDYQRYLSENQTPIFDESGLYRHLSDSNGSPASKVPMSEVYRKLSTQGQDNMLQLGSKSNRPNSS
ncbi:uncharacterized protein LOC129961004 [Argiope bruennichi]|uniref:Uncharacterized protein n=1 Tax=Argiope bruennichi TaxID=94029 RepID=A0A8T0FFI5_ARGBR|nr:uncharacterized protein LOC129961004 [Argiope bruennichi]KAF8790044.1 hypothetical protein HNY73_005128 [Argiope bruennichi]